MTEHELQKHISEAKDDVIEVSLSKKSILGMVLAALLAVAGFYAYQNYKPATGPSTGTSNDSLVTLTVLTDKTCGVCDPTEIIASLKQLFTNMDVKTVDIATSEGRALATKIEVAALPAYVFTGSVAQSESYAQIQRYLDAKDDSYLLRVGGDQKLIGRSASTEPKVDLFVMSQCPYGVQAENNMDEVLKNFGSAVKMNIYFIASESGETFNSLHGQVEVDEDLRQVCVIKYAPTKLMGYLNCVNADIANVATKWESCAKDAGIDSAKIKTCAEGAEGKALLSENIKVAESLGVGGSPGFLINNQVLAGGLRSPDQIKQLICGENPGLEGCENTLSGGTAASGSC